MEIDRPKQGTKEEKSVAPENESEGHTERWKENEQGRGRERELTSRKRRRKEKYLGIHWLMAVIEVRCS